MRKVFLVTGFNNWGKTTLLYDLFNVKAFRRGVAYSYAGCSFFVLPKSNDDLGKRGYEREYRDCLKDFVSVNGDPACVASVFCPTRESRNKSIEIIRNIYAEDQIEMLLLEYKWCGQGKLLATEIEHLYAALPNFAIHRVSARSREGKLAKAQAILSSTLP